MDRAEATGFGVAVAGHGALLAVLALGIATATNPTPLQQAMEVSFVDEINLVSAAPVPAIEPPAPSIAPELGPPEESMPAPEPAPARPEPAPAPPEPAPAPKQAEPAPSRERAKPQAVRERPADSKRKAAAAAQERPRGSRLGADLLKGIGRDPSPSRETNPPAATMSRQAAADIGSAIKRQVQPCADQQVNPGPGANRIVTSINLRLNRDGSLSGRPRVVGQTGIDDENRRYADRVADLAIASFVGCAPLRGLPDDLYDVPNGWRNFTMNYSLPG